jgi:hypothetical protein
MGRQDPIQHLIELNLQTKYEQFFKVDVRHDYFEGGMFPAIEIIPDKMTKVRLKQYQLKAACDGPSLIVGFGSASSTGPSIAQIDKPVKLSFWLKINDQDFLNYTNVPYEFGDYIYHFTNRDEDKIEDEFANLSNSQYVEEMDRLPLTGRMFDYRFEDPMDDVEVQVTNELGEVVFEQQMEGEATMCTIRLDDADPGKYTLLLDGLDEFSFYLAGDGIRNMFGVIDIYIDKEDDGEFSLFTEDGNPVLKKDFNIHFKNRAVRWKYLFLETNMANPQHIEHEIYNSGKSGGDVKFTKAEEVELDDGSMAVMIETEGPVPFKEKQEERFKLRSLRGKSKIEWVTDLPVPSAKSMLKVNINDKNDVFSEIIVYL